MTAAVERAAHAALFWSQPCRRSEAAVRAVVDGLSDTERWAVCGILASGELDKLDDDALLAKMHELAAKARPIENKIAEPERKSAPVAVLDRPPAAADSGSFVGYLAAWSKDLGGDTIEPSAVTRTLADRAAGRLTWLITDSHSQRASDVVGVVESAVADGRGVRVEGRWASTDAGQNLRRMARDGLPIGLSIDYLVRDSRPDGAGGRVLTDIQIVGGAVTNAPMNPQCVIVAGKDAAGGFEQVRTVEQEIAAGSARNDPERERRRRQAQILSAAAWPPPELVDALGVDAAYGLLEGAARAKTARAVQHDPERARAQARRDRANEESFALARTLARLERENCGHRSCMPGRCAYGG